MRKHNSKIIVVDTSIARSASEMDFPISKACRDSLYEILTFCHRIVITDDILIEWKKHRSRFTVTWLSSMFARRKVIQIEMKEQISLLKKIERCVSEEKDLQAVKKDLHLVEAALMTDKIIISRDEALRIILRETAKQVSELRDLAFANPVIAEERVVEWLKNGAETDKRRLLGFDSLNQE